MNNKTSKTVRFALTKGGVRGQWTFPANKTVRFALTKDGFWWESTAEAFELRPPRWRNVITVVAPALGLLNFATNVQHFMS